MNRIKWSKLHVWRNLLLMVSLCDFFPQPPPWLDFFEADGDPTLPVTWPFWIFSSGAKSRGWAEATNPRPTLFSITVTLSRWIRTSQKLRPKPRLVDHQVQSDSSCAIVQWLPKEIDGKGWKPPSLVTSLGGWKWWRCSSGNCNSYNPSRRRAGL